VVTVLRQWFRQRIPTQDVIADVSAAQMASNEADGLLHLFLAVCDCAWGVFGARVPFVTISSRTAVAIMTDQHGGAEASLAFLALAWALEAIDPGHLQSARVADVCRQIQGLQILSPVLAQRVAPKE